MIPIPLYVTVEMIKLFMGSFIDWDEEMYSPEIDRCANESIPAKRNNKPPACAGDLFPEKIAGHSKSRNTRS